MRRTRKETKIPRNQTEEEKLDDLCVKARKIEKKRLEVQAVSQKWAKNLFEKKSKAKVGTFVQREFEMNSLIAF